VAPTQRLLGIRLADHLLGCFAFTLTFCLAWPRPFAVDGAVVALALLLEGLQAFTLLTLH
jgi:hypothetical protein